MKKSLLLAGLLSASAMMAETQFFVGAGLERADVNYKISDDWGWSDSGSIKDSALKISAGVIVEKSHRIAVSYAGYSKDGTDVDLTLLNYDYLIPLSNDKTSLKIGVHAGSSKFDEDTDTVSDTAFSYGIQTGLIFDITSNVSFEATIAYTKLNLEDSYVDWWGDTVKAELEDTTSIGFGINYKF